MSEDSNRKELFGSIKADVGFGPENDARAQGLHEQKLAREREENKQHKKIFEFRTKYYERLFFAICVYIVLVLITIWLNKVVFGLDDTVLITLLSTTTANVLGAFFIASNWVFPNKE